MMHHRVRKASLVNPVFTDQQFDALRTVDAHLGAARMGLKEAADVLAKDLQVNEVFSYKTELLYNPVALKVYAKLLSAYAEWEIILRRNCSEVCFSRGIHAKSAKSSSPRDTGWVTVPGQGIDIIFSVLTAYV